MSEIPKPVPSADFASERFLEMLVRRAYHGSIRSLTSILADGPQGLEPQPYLTELHRWYRLLDESSREKVIQVVREAVEAAIFGVLVLLDGMTGGDPMPGTVSDFAVYLQTYESDEARKSNSPLSKVRLNPAYTGDDLHHQFISMLESRGK